MAFPTSRRNVAPTKELFSPRTLIGAKTMDGRVIKTNAVGGVKPALQPEVGRKAEHDARQSAKAGTDHHALKDIGEYTDEEA